MDDERDRLVALLRHKLTELDAQVVAYRRDCADDFRRFAAELLQPVPADVAAAVAHAFDGPDGARETREAYAALYPGLLDGHDAGGDRDSADAGSPSILAPPPPSRAHRPTSPPPILYHTSGVPKDGPRRPLAATPTLASTLSSPTIDAVAELPFPAPVVPEPPRVRDNELRGVFTPPFLPLLDSSSATRWPDGASDVADPSAKKDKGAEEQSQLAPASQPPPPLPAPPKQKPLKSALRKPTVRFPSRSSLSRAQPPPMSEPSSPGEKRHVRFSFGGEEVLPTESPPRDDRIIDDEDDRDGDLLWLMPDNRHSYSYNYNIPVPPEAALLPTPAEPALPIPIAPMLSKHGMDRDTASGPISGLGPDSGPAPTTQSLLPGEECAAPIGDSENAVSYNGKQGAQERDDDEEDEFIPLARKVSSSDRLRALSKMPLEDPSMWTVVNPQADTANAAAADSAEAPSVDSLSNSIPAARPSWRGASPSIPTAADGDDSEDEDREDDFVAMRFSRKNSQSSMSQLSPRSPATAAVPPRQQLPDATTAGTAPPSLVTNGNAGPRTKAVDVVVENVPAEDDFFDFEQDMEDAEPGSGGSNDNDLVGYPLTRTVAASPGIDAVADVDLDIDAGAVADVDAGQPDHEPATAAVAEDEKEDALAQDGRVDSNAATLAINCERKAAPSDSDAASNAVPIRRETGVVPGSLVGSYRGRPLSMFGVVKDPRILEQAAALGDVSSFVGSIDGRTGVDDDIALGAHSAAGVGVGSVSLSGRDAVLHLLSGTPRSLTERMAMEDARAHLATAPSPQS